MSVTRSRFATLTPETYGYYQNLAQNWGEAYPYTCHKCGVAVIAGGRFCTLQNVVDQYGNRQSFYWCAECASDFPREGEF